MVWIQWIEGIGWIPRIELIGRSKWIERIQWIQWIECIGWIRRIECIGQTERIEQIKWIQRFERMGSGDCSKIGYWGERLKNAKQEVLPELNV